MLKSREVDKPDKCSTCSPASRSSCATACLLSLEKPNGCAVKSGPRVSMSPYCGDSFTFHGGSGLDCPDVWTGRGLGEKFCNSIMTTQCAQRPRHGVSEPRNIGLQP